jgi:hypothetical protein
MHGNVINKIDDSVDPAFFWRLAGRSGPFDLGTKKAAGDMGWS